MTIKIDPEFKALIPDLSDDEYAALESSILAEGCRDAIVLWGDVIVDGHNRYEICTAHNIPFKTVNHNFKDRTEAKEWMIMNQLARRNLQKFVYSELALKLKPFIEERAKKNQLSTLKQNATVSQKSVERIDTQKEVAKIAGVSHDTIAKVEKILEVADEDTKNALRRGDVSINKVYKTIKASERDAKEKEILATRAKNFNQPEPNFHLADCMDKLSDYPDNYFDLAIVDPPYGISADTGVGGFGTASARHYVSEWDSAIPSNDYFKELFRVSRNQIIWGAQYMIKHLDAGTKWVVWDKAGETEFHNPYSKCELAWTSFSGNVDKFVYKQMGFVSEDKSIRIHPTQKPVALYEWLLDKFATDGDKILDTHVGSGSSLIACWRKGFDFVGYEIDEQYYNLATQRLAEERASHG